MTEQEADPPILTTRRGGVLTVAINRPHVRNALNSAALHELATAYRELEEDDDLRVGVVTGEGGYFSSGMDLKDFARGEMSSEDAQGNGSTASLTDDPVFFATPRKPLIAAIEGFAVAGGLELALACDLIVAARGALLGIPETKRGLTAGGGGCLRLASRIPYHVAMELALLGEPISAERGFEIGLVNRLADPGAALDEALKLATAVAGNAPLGVAVSKELVRSSWNEREGWERQAELVRLVEASDDAREGALAFVEKREPQWTGR